MIYGGRGGGVLSPPQRICGGATLHEYIKFKYESNMNNVEQL